MKLNCFAPYSWIKHILQLLFSKETGSGAVMRNMSILASGTAAAQIVSFASAPVITRIYSPANLGVLSIFVVILSFLTPFITLRYSAAIPLPRRNGTATNLLALCFCITLAMSMVISVVSWLFGEYLFRALSVSELNAYWWLIGVALLATGTYEILSTWATREKQFKILAKTRMTQSVAGAVVKITLGLFELKPFGLLLGNVISQGAGIISLFLRSRNNIIKGLRSTRRKTLQFLMKRYVDFPRYQIPSRFLLVFIQKAPLLAMAFYYDAGVVGQMGLAFMVVEMPAALVITSASQSLFADIAKIGKKEPRRIYSLTKSVSLKMLLIGLIPCSLLFVFGPLLFSVVFGSEWQLAGEFARILSILLLARFAASPIISTMTVLEEQHIILKMNIATTILTAAVFALPKMFGIEPILLTFIYVIAITLQTSVYYYVVMNTISKSGNNH